MTFPNDFEIAHAASLRPIADVAADVGLSADQLDQYGSDKAKLRRSFLDTMEPKAKLVIVTAVTPTAAGEGKTTVTVGLAQALLFRGKSPRMASMVAGGAYFLFLVCLPMTGIADGFYGPVLLGICYFTMVGAMLGYVTGTLVGSVFMVADWMYRFRNRNNPEQPDP